MTTAVTLWFVMGVAVAAYAGWASIAVAGGANPWIYVAGAFLVYAAILFTITATWFAIAWIWRAARPPSKRIGLAASVRMFAGELFAIARSGPRMAVYRWLFRDPDPAPATTPVLLLHGVLCNAGVWRGMRAELVRRGIGPVYTMSYGPPLASIELFVEQLATKVDTILAATGASRVSVVGHSMGGLVARAYLRRFGTAKVASLLSLGGPHHGSVHAWLFPGICLGQLRPGNAWLEALNRTEGAPSPVRLMSVWSWHDSMVAPQTSARLAGAENVELQGIGHNALLVDRRVYAIVVRELAEVARENRPS
jgi:triacylglycerol esterase/lipase EstA (alpha/beta hydrolase family)